MADGDSSPTSIEIEELKELFRKKVFHSGDQGWHICPNARVNDGALGNLLETLLGIQENNLQIPDLNGIYELKTQRIDTNSRVSLFHVDPEPRRCTKCGKKRSFVQKVMLSRYGWPHKEAGRKHPEDELSLRLTMNPACDRGFRVVREENRLLVSFDSDAVETAKEGYAEWLDTVAARCGLAEIDPQPYWDIDDIQSRFEAKLGKIILVECEVERRGDQKWVRYTSASLLAGVSSERFIERLLEDSESSAVVEFDTRTGHNHGTKFRIYRKDIPDLYAENSLIGRSPFT